MVTSHCEEEQHQQHQQQQQRPLRSHLPHIRIEPFAADAALWSQNCVPSTSRCTLPPIHRESPHESDLTASGPQSRASCQDCQGSAADMTSLRPLVTPPPVGDPCGGFHSTSGRKRPKWRSYPIHAVCETDETPARHPPATSAASTSAGLEKPSRKDKQSLNYVLRSGFAGGVAGCVAKTAIAPLDRVKILFQAQNPEFQKYSGHWLGVFRAGKDIVSSQGVPALFKGHSATLMRIFPYAAIKYMAYDKLHFALMPTRELETSSRLFVAGAASGVLSVFLTYPLELIRVRLAFETKSSRGASSAAAPFDGRTRGSLSRIVRQIYTEGSTEAPFSVDARRRAARAKSASHGAAGSAHSSSPASSGSAHTQPPSGQYQSSRHLATTASLWQAATRPPGIAQAQAEALAAGASASSPVPPSAPTTTLQTADSLLQRYPLMKFYRGFSVTVLGMIPYAGTSFLVFGRCKRGLQRAFGVDDGPTDGVTRPSQHKQARWQPSKTTIDLSSGALAGAISQTAAYPFEVVRRRQQVAALVRPGGMVGMVETTMWIWKTSGFKGFYTGLSIGFLKVVPMTSVSFAVWLGMKRWMQI